MELFELCQRHGSFNVEHTQLIGVQILCLLSSKTEIYMYKGQFQMGFIFSKWNQRQQVNTMNMLVQLFDWTLEWTTTLSFLQLCGIGERLSDLE